MKECPNCKKLNPEGNAFCDGCGNSLDNSANVQNNNLNNNEQSNNKNQNVGTTKNGYNKNAVTSIICSIISLFIFWWLAFVGISCGVAALKEIKDKGQKGKVLAIIGIIIAVIDLVLYFVGRMI